MLVPFLLLGSAAQRPAFLQSIQRLNTVAVTQWIPHSLQLAADGSTVGALSFTSAPFSTVPWTTASGTNDIVVAKWDAAGNLQWHTYFVPTDTSTNVNALTSLTLDATGVYVALTIRRPVWLEGATMNYTFVPSTQDILAIAKLDIATGLGLWGTQNTDNVREGYFDWSNAGNLVLVGRKSGIVQYPVDATTGTLDTFSSGVLTSATTSRLLGAVVDRAANQIVAAYTANSNGYLYLVTAGVGAFGSTDLRILLTASTWTSFSLSIPAPNTVAVAVSALTSQTVYPNAGSSTAGTQLSVPAYGSTGSAFVFVIDRGFGTSLGQLVDLRKYPRSASLGGGSVSAAVFATAPDGTLWVAGRYNLAVGGGVLDLGGVNLTEADSLTYSFVAQVDSVSTTCQTVRGTWTCSNPPDVVNVETFPANFYALAFKNNNSRVLGLSTSPATSSVVQFAQFSFQADAPPLERPYLATTYTACRRSQFQQVAPTVSTDRTCATYSVCTSGYFESSPPTPTSDRQCRLISQCAAGTYLVTPATATTDNICAPWKTCPTGFTVSRVGTNLSDVFCAALTCTDGFQNLAETDIDCGGAQCPGCRQNQKCVSFTDCAGSAAQCFGTCYTSQCADGALNGEETDFNCGGSVCAGCAFGRRCNINQDCATNYWCAPVNGTKRCIPPCTHTALLALGDGIAGTNGACSTVTPTALPLLPSQWTLQDVMMNYNISADSPNCQAPCKDALSTALSVCNGVVRGSAPRNEVKNQGIEGFLLALQKAQTKCGGTIYPPGDKTPQELLPTPTPKSGAVSVVAGIATLLGLLVL